MMNDLEILKRARSFFSENKGGSELLNTFASLSEHVNKTKPE